MTPRGRLAVLGACAVVALLTAWYAGSQMPAGSADPTGSVRLGPDAGEPVAAYLARLPADLPPVGVAAPALVQFATEQTAGAVAVGGTPVVAVFRVPVPRVQTAIRFQPLEPDVPAATAVAAAREAARLAAEGDVARLTGRPRAVAAAEAAALADAARPCLVALVVVADGAVLTALALRPGVRAVHAAPPGTATRELALAPLLPEQTDRADPPPDDGEVPT